MTAIVIGRLGNDPKMNSDKTARFTVVRTIDERVEFIQCVVTAKQAELVMRYLKKGMLICIEGNWGGSENQILVAKKVVFLSPVSK